MNLAGRTKVFAVLLIIAALLLSFGCAKKAAQTPQQKPVSPHVNSSQQFAQEEPAKLGPPTVVAEGMTPSDHVKKYYQAYKDQKWQEAYDLQPAGSKARESVDSYTESHKVMPLNSFTVSEGKEEADKTMSVEAILDLGGQGAGSKWMTVWTFTKDGDNWVADKTQSGIKPQ